MPSKRLDGPTWGPCPRGFGGSGHSPLHQRSRTRDIHDLGDPKSHSFRSGLGEKLKTALPARKTHLEDWCPENAAALSRDHQRSKDSGDGDASSSTSEPLHVKRGFEEACSATESAGEESCGGEGRGLLREGGEFRDFVNQKQGELTTPMQVDRFLTEYMNSMSSMYSMYLAGHPAGCVAIRTQPVWWRLLKSARDNPERRIPARCVGSSRPRVC